MDTGPRPLVDHHAGPGDRPHHHGDWGIQPLWEVLHPLLPGVSIEVVDRLPSTNATLVERLRDAARGAREAHGRGLRADDLRPTLLVAVDQTQGRGRLGRTWQSAPGASLTFSLSLALERADWSGLSLAVGVAIAGALDASGTRIGLKWPNDLWLREGVAGRKLGGVLIEAIGLAEHRMAVIGVGLNVLPVLTGPQVADTAASLSEIDPQATPAGALARLMPALARTLLRFEREGFAGFEAAYAERDLLRGGAVVTTDAACPRGTAQGVAADGSLRVRDDAGREHRILSGEVSVRPALPGASAPTPA